MYRTFLGGKYLKTLIWVARVSIIDGNNRYVKSCFQNKLKDFFTTQHISKTNVAYLLCKMLELQCFHAGIFTASYH